MLRHPRSQSECYHQLTRANMVEFIIAYNIMNKNEKDSHGALFLMLLDLVLNFM